MDRQDILYTIALGVLAFLLAFLSLIPEFKIKNNLFGTEKSTWEKILLFIRKPSIRITSLIMLSVVTVYLSITKEQYSNEQANNEVERRDNKRKQEDFNRTQIITESLKDAKLQIDYLNKRIIELKDRTQIKEDLKEKILPDLIMKVRIDSVNNGVRKIKLYLISMYGKSMDINLKYSVAVERDQTYQVISSDNNIAGGFDISSGDSRDIDLFLTLHKDIDNVYYLLQGSYKNQYGKLFKINDLIGIAFSKKSAGPPIPVVSRLLMAEFENVRRQR